MASYLKIIVSTLKYNDVKNRVNQTGVRVCTDLSLDFGWLGQQKIYADLKSKVMNVDEKHSFGEIQISKNWCFFSECYSKFDLQVEMTCQG